MHDPYHSIINEIITTFHTSSPRKPVFIQRTKFRQKTWTVRNVIGCIKKIQDFLKQKSINPNNTILICAPNSPVWGCIFLASAIEHVTIVPLDFNSSDEFIENIIKKTEPKMLFISRYKEIHIKLQTEMCFVEDLEEMIKETTNISLTTLQQPLFTKDQILEIVFTSGSTGHPKGTIVTHENITENIHNLMEVITVNPNTRLLSIIPLSHMFEQSIGFFIALRFGITITYPFIITPTELMRALKDSKVTTMVCVPVFLKLIKDSIEREAEQRNTLTTLHALFSVSKYLPFSLRRILFLNIHKNFGGHLREFLVGGAPLEPSMEDFWHMLGVTVSLGYGATECSPIITMSSGKYYKKHSVGKVLPHQEIKLLSDGEILVKGKNVSSGYFKEPEATATAFQDHWFHTGDIGETDKDGNIFIKGRSKNVIVTTAGMKIYPEDIESKLNQFGEIRDSVVLGIEKNGAIIITAVILPNNIKTDFQPFIQKVNESLASHQRIQDVIIWEKPDFPRTPTKKVIRTELITILKQSEKGQSENAKKNTDPLLRILSDLSSLPEEKISPESNLVLDLKLDSIKKLELLSRIEEEMGGYLDEQAINQYVTVADLQKNITLSRKTQSDSVFMSWQITPVIAFIRILCLGVLFRLLSVFQTLHVTKTNHKNVYPVIYIANHTSHLDAPTLLKSLSRKARHKTAVAAAKDYFFTNSFKAAFMRILLNAFPVDREKNITETLLTIGNVLDRGYSIIIFPEGTRSTNGEMHAFKQGIGLIAQTMDVPIIPVKIRGNFTLLPKGKTIPKKGVTDLRFGAPVSLGKNLSYIETTEIIEKTLKEL